MSNIIDSIQLSGTTYQIQGSGGGEGTVSALTETNPVAIQSSTYYTGTTVDVIYIKSLLKTGSFSHYYALQGSLSNNDRFYIIVAGNATGITSVESSTAFTSTITDGIAKIEFVSPLELREVYYVKTEFVCYYFPPTPYTSGSTSEVVEGAVYDSLRKLSLETMEKNTILGAGITTEDNGIVFYLNTDKSNINSSLELTSPTINMNGGVLNTQFSSSTTSQLVLNVGEYNICDLFYNKSYDDLTITFNPSYTGGYTSTVFSIRAKSGSNTYYLVFTYDITNNSVSYGNNWSTYFTTVDTLSTDYKLKIVANTGYKIYSFGSSDCLIGGVDGNYPNEYVTNLITTTSNVHDGQEVIDDLYANKQDKLSAGTGINITDNVISATGGGGGNPTIELTQAQYDALVTAGTVQADTYYIITDAQAGDLTNYYTKTETNTLLGGKADTATTYTKTEVDNAITAATSTKQDTLVSGTNIKTINNTSILGSGNIDIQGGGGGGKAIEAGRGISITTGETADTVSFNLPISAGTGENSIVGNIAQNTASGKNALALGGFYISQSSYGLSVASGLGSVSFGGNASGEQSFAAASMASTASGQRSATIAGYSNDSKGIESLTSGRYVKAENMWECSFGYSNVSHKANNTWGDSGNTLFSVGNGTSTSARHNAFEIRQNGDIYITSGGTDIKLQDNLGGGGGGKAVTGGTNISVTTGETADTINCTLPIVVTNSFGTCLDLTYGSGNDAQGSRAITLGAYTKTTNNGELAIGRYNVSNTTSASPVYNNPNKTVFSVGNGTSNDARHNAFEIRQNGDVYLNDGTNDVKLQDYLQIKVVKLTQSAYDALSPDYDSNTLYVIVN